MRIESIFGSKELRDNTVQENAMQILVSGSACVAHGQYAPDPVMQLTCKAVIRLADHSPEPY